MTFKEHLQEGLDQAKRREFVKGPDLEADAIKFPRTKEDVQEDLDQAIHAWCNTDPDTKNTWDQAEYIMTLEDELKTL